MNLESGSVTSLVCAEKELPYDPSVFSSIRADLNEIATPQDAETNFVQVKEEPPDYPLSPHNIPSDFGWAVEFESSKTLHSPECSVAAVFAETDYALSVPQCFLPQTCFLKASSSFAQVENLCVGEILYGPRGAVSVEGVKKLDSCLRRIVILEFRTARCSFRVAVNDDHRMRLPHNVYCSAQDLTRNRSLCTTEGDLPIQSIEHVYADTPVYAITLVGDRSVFMSMPSVENTAMVAAFGAPHQLQVGWVEFRFKGAICNGWNAGRGSAEAWVMGIRQLRDLPIQFLASAPYSVFVRREHADNFYELTKTLLPKHARLRRSHDKEFNPAGWELLSLHGCQHVTEEELRRAMPTTYEE